MSKPISSPRPTDGELAILRVLWDRGPSTVRQVHASLGRDTAYTTVLKLLQIMAEKGLVTRDLQPPPHRTHIYAAAHPAQATQRQLLRDLLDKAFAGSASELVLQALSARRASPEELQQIRQLLDQYEHKGDRP
jgi:BlaI family transcriptional regulator, penicillinase repressor